MGLKLDVIGSSCSKNIFMSSTVRNETKISSTNKSDFNLPYECQIAGTLKLKLSSQSFAASLFILSMICSASCKLLPLQ